MAVTFGMLCKVVETVRSVNQGFGRNATANQAGASRTLSFNDDGFQAKLCGANCGYIASWACANNKNLTFHNVHFKHLT